MADDMGAPPRAGSPSVEAPRPLAPASMGPGPGVGAGIHGAVAEAPGIAEANATGPMAAVKAPPKIPLRRRLFTGLAVVVVLGGLAYGAWYAMVGSHFVSTDNAYVGADTATVTPQVNGQVAEVRVGETQAVNAGDVLVVVDPADARLALAQAQAEYGRAVRRVQQNFASTDAFTAQIAARDADLARARAQAAAAQGDLARARIDLERREALAKSGAVSGEELTSSKNAFQTAQANLEAVRAGGVQAQANRVAAVEQQKAQAALTQGETVDQNPEVLAARAMLDTARLNLDRTTIRAPIAGVVSRKTVNVGQRVAIGAPLMSIAPTATAYVDANFKEVQLRKVRPGQPVEMTADLYGDKVVYHGRVQGFAGGTGSAFAVIPAQNATGNWIKVVQRLPVRIRLDPRELAAHPLRVGLSMSTRIDIAAQGDRGAPAA